MKAIILCGGIGSRLWPLSQKEKPKQLHRLVSENSLLQETILRVAEKGPVDEIMLVYNHEYASAIQEQVDELDLEKNVIHLMEQVPLGTGPAILKASLMFEEDDDILIMPSDHLFDNDKFMQLVSQAQAYLNQDIVCFGIVPTHPATGYGYLKKNAGSVILEQFVEKPCLEVAKEYVKSGNYLWNSGVFMSRVSVLHQAFMEHAPEMWQATLDLDVTDGILGVDLGCVKDSIDYAVMEKVNNAVVLPYLGMWSDIGDWNALSQVVDQDDQGNTMIGNVVMTGTTNTYVRTDGDLVAVVGLDNCVVVKNGNQILVMSKDKCQDIKKCLQMIN